MNPWEASAPSSFSSGCSALDAGLTDLELMQELAKSADLGDAWDEAGVLNQCIYANMKVKL